MPPVVGLVNPPVVAAILEAVAEAVLVVGPDGRVQAASEAAARLLGASEGEQYPAAAVLVGRSLRALAPAIDLAAFVASREEREVDIGPTRILVRCAAAAGGHVVVAIRPTVNDGTSERSAILAATSDGMLLVDPSGRVGYANRRFGRLVGLGTREIAGGQATALAFLLRGCEPDPLDAFDRVLLPPDAARELPEVRCHVNRPRPRALRLSAGPVVDASGALLGRLVVARDITDEEAAARAQERVVGDVSHELRTPLTSIRGFVDLLRQGRAGPLLDKQQEILTIVDQNARRLQALVDGLLEAERAERTPLEAVPVPLAPLLRETLGQEREAAERAGLALVHEDPTPGLAALADPDRLRQVVTNLVGNAVKYTPTGRVVVRTFEVAPGRVALVVEDTGIGIRVEDHPRIFERFFRADDPVVRRAAGTGLGLAIVRTLVERMDGVVTIESARGEGTRVTVELPAAPRGEGA